MLQRWNRRATKDKPSWRDWQAIHDSQILDPDADDVLLAALAQDNKPHHYYPSSAYRDPTTGPWADKQREKHKAYLAWAKEHEAEWAPQISRDRAVYEQRHKERQERKRLLDEEMDRQNAEYLKRQNEHYQAIRNGWIAMIQAAIDEARGSKYDALVADLEHDIATIRAWPAGAPPGEINRARFLAEFERRKRWIDDQC
jgi:hypothetical protein